MRLVFFIVLLLLPAYCTSNLAPAGTLPDLTVQFARNDLYPNCWSPTITRHVIRVTLFNVGGGDAGAFEVSIDTETVTVAGLAAGATIEVMIEYRAGASIAAIIVDPQNNVAESDETNNQYTPTIYTFTPPPPCPTATP